MSVGYNEAMFQLKSMFETIDEEIIKCVLANNNGNIEPSIDELLQLQNQSSPSNNARGSRNNNQSRFEDDNMFASGPAGGNNNQRKNYPQLDTHEDFNNFGNKNNLDYNNGYNNNSFAGFGGNGGSTPKQTKKYGNLNKEEQERVDAEMAYNLQREYMQQDQMVEQQIRAQSSQGGRPGTAQNGMPGVQKQKKKGVFAKISSGVKKIFDKKGKGKGPTNMDGGYSNIDKIGDDDHDGHFFQNVESLDNHNDNYQGNNFAPSSNNRNNDFGSYGNNFSNNNNNNRNNDFGSNNNKRNNDFGSNNNNRNMDFESNFSNNNNNNNNVNKNHDFGSWGNNNSNSNNNNNFAPSNNNNKGVNSFFSNPQQAHQQEDDDNDAPMKLDDILNARGINDDEDDGGFKKSNKYPKFTL